MGAENRFRRKGVRLRAARYRSLLYLVLILAVFVMWAVTGAGWIIAIGPALLITGIVAITAGRRFGLPARAAMIQLGIVHCFGGAVFVGLWWLMTHTDPDSREAPMVRMGATVWPVLMYFVFAVVHSTWSYWQIPRTGVAWRCRSCGHFLYGLTEPRCPECGHPLSQIQLDNALPGQFAAGDHGPTDAPRDRSRR